MRDPDDGERLAQLEKRIAKLRAKDAPKPHQEEHYSQAQAAWQMVIELVTGLLIGFGIGYGLDSLAGTMPAFLIAFTLLGFAAGVKTMMRSARKLQQQAGPAERTSRPEPGANDNGPGTGVEKRADDGD